MTVAVGRLHITVAIAPERNRRGDDPPTPAERAHQRNNISRELEADRTRWILESQRWI